MKTKAPQYQVIYNQILKKIRKGEFSKEVPVPSENELAQKYHVSRMTARKSVDMLVNEGYLIRHKGRGTFITGRRSLKKEAVGFTQRMKDEGRKVYTEVKSFSVVKSVNEEIAEILDVSNEYVVVCERTRYVDDKPCIFETIYIPQKFVEDATDEAFTASITELLNEYAEVGSITMKCEAGVLKKKAAKQLGLKKDDMTLMVRSIMYFMDGRAASYSVSSQNTELLEFETTIMK